MIGALQLHYDRFGWRGLSALLRSRWSARPQPIRFRHADARHPIHLRVGASDVATFEQVFVQHEYRFHAAQEPRVIVDAGANIGLAAIQFATRYPRARILAIEPERGNYEILCRNLAPYPNALAIQAALWNRDTSIELVDPGLGSWGFMTRTGPATNRPDRAASAVSVHRVRALTVDTLMRENGLSHIDILKLDIEGAELEVLEQPQAWIDRVQSMIVELHERMKPGCDASFEAVASQFPNRWLLGENHYLSRAGGISPSPISHGPISPGPNSDS